MKISSVIFLGLLLFISCTSEHFSGSLDSVLLQFNSDPKAEAIFATMAIQLKQAGGFDRVLALLNQLVDDSKKQLHENNKLWRGVEARCEVSTTQLKQQQDFYEARQAAVEEASKGAQMDQAHIEDNNKAYGAASDLYKKFLEDEKVRHKELKDFYVERNKHIANAIEETQKATDAVTNWTPGDTTKTAFIQSSLNKVSDAYLQTHSYKIFIPSSFVELAATDEQVKQRILEWLAELRVAFLEAKSTWEGVLNNRINEWTALEKGVEDLLYVYEEDIKYGQKLVGSLKANADNLEKAAKTFKDLVDKNKGLMESNKNYCDVEETNYNKAKTTLVDQVKLFQEIRTYFKDNYSKISKFIHDKYNEPKP